MKILSDARANLAQWRWLVGWRPVCGHVQFRRYSTRAVTAAYSLLSLIPMAVIIAADSWSPVLDLTTTCFADGGRGPLAIPFNVFDVTNPPDGIECSEGRPFNAIVYYCLLWIGVMVLIAGAYLFDDPDEDFDPDREDTRVLSRYFIKLKCPGYIEVDRRSVEGLSFNQVDDLIKAEIRKNTVISIIPFADDVASLANLSHVETVAFKAVARNWINWARGRSKTDVIVDFEGDDTNDWPNAEGRPTKNGPAER